MSEYTTVRSSRSGSVRNPASYGSAGDVVTYPNIPRIYSAAGNSIVIKKGSYVFPKAGELVFFFSDSNGSKQIQKSKGQVSDPFRVASELVGTATGKVATGVAGSFIEVDWVNSYVDHKLFKADEKVNEPKIGWVYASKVNWQDVYQSADEMGATDAPVADTADSSNAPGGSIDTTTLGFAAVAAAVIFSKKKGKK